MPRLKLFLGIVAFLCAAGVIYWVLNHDLALVANPKGIIAYQELKLIKTNILLMLIVVVPTLITLFTIAWRYRAKNRQAEHDPEHAPRVLKQPVLWLIPSVVIVVLSFITWKATHHLDPYRPLESETKQLTIQVVAFDWKWLFIYPEQGIASLNYVQIPEKTPIRFELTGDGSPMNSFWVPQLSGQLYAMTGMVTPLHVMADGPGIYSGRAAEINGKGYATMTFTVQSSSQADFEAWVSQVKKSPQQLTMPVYNALIKPSLHDPVTLYSNVEKDLFNQVVMKYMHPPKS